LWKKKWKKNQFVRHQQSSQVGVVLFLLSVLTLSFFIHSRMLFFIWLFYSAFSILKRLFWSPQHVPVPPAPESSAFVSTKRKMAILKGGALNALRWIACE
jgi:hypothetical protein